MDRPDRAWWTLEERFVPVTESGERWAPRDAESAADALHSYPHGGTYLDGTPYDGVTHVLRETRYVTEWTNGEG